MIRLAGVLALLSLLVACGPDKTVNAPTSPGEDGGAKTSGSTSSGAAPDVTGTKTLFVKETLADCEGEGPRKCLQIRESRTEPWTLFYSSIEGFKHEEGNEYELKVKVTSAGSAPPADVSSQKYKLVEIVSKAPKK